MALKDMDVGVKILGGLVAFSLLMAMMSNGDPDNDAWGAGTPPEDGETDEDDRSDPWSAGPADGADVPECDGVATFTMGEGTIRLPVHGPVVPFPSAVCQLGPRSRDAEAVASLQHALAACNGQVLAVDGAYGADTTRAVAAVQGALGLEADGLYGPQTRVAMAWPTEPGSAGAAADPEDGAADADDPGGEEDDAADADDPGGQEDDAPADPDGPAGPEGDATADADLDSAVGGGAGAAPSSACISGD